MRKIKNLLFIIAILLSCFIGVKTVSAATISNSYITCGDIATDGDALISSCSVDTEAAGAEADMYTARLVTWYNTGTLADPGAPLDLSGVYESGYRYMVELALTPTEGNSFSFDEENPTDFHLKGIGGTGWIVNEDLNGETIVRFVYYPNHVVHFETYGGTVIPDRIVAHGESMAMPKEPPVKDGFIFINWYKDSAFENACWVSIWIEESMTVYAKFISKEFGITNVNVTLEAPTVGTEVVLVEEPIEGSTNSYWMVQHPKPVAYGESGMHYVLDYSDWVQGLCVYAENYEDEDHSCDHKYTGFIEAGEYYYAFMEVTADDGYAFDPDALTITVNGKTPEQIYGVSRGIYLTFTAKIKADGDPITDVSKAKVTGIKTQTYNGKQQRQTIVVTLAGKELVKGTDYQVYYSSLTNAGTIKMTIKGLGDYNGTLVKKFTRKKAKNTLKIKSADKTVYYSKVKNGAQVVKPITILKRQGKVTYTKLSGSSPKLTINKTTGKVTVKKGTKKGNYIIRIKVSAAGNTNYLSKYIIRTVYVTVK